MPPTSTGNTFRIGSGAPADTLGVDDDTYLDKDAGTFYLRASGAYTSEYTAGSAGSTGTADVLIDELGTNTAAITLTTNRFWVGTGITIPDGVHGILIDLSPATDDYHFVDWDTIRLKTDGVVGVVSDATQYETFVAQTVTGVGHLVRIGHDGSNQVLLADDAGTGINIDFLRIERLLVPINAVGLSELQITTLIQTALAAAVIGNTETGITVTHNADGTFDFVVGAMPAPTHTSYVAVDADTDFTAAEFLAGTSGVGNALAVPTFTGTAYVGFARPVSAGTITAVYLYAQGSPNTINVIGAYTVETAALDVGSENHYVVRSNNALSPPIGYVLVMEVA